MWAEMARRVGGDWVEMAQFVGGEGAACGREIAWHVDRDEVA